MPIIKQNIIFCEKATSLRGGATQSHGSLDIRATEQDIGEKGDVANAPTRAAQARVPGSRRDDRNERVYLHPLFSWGFLAIVARNVALYSASAFAKGVQ